MRMELGEEFRMTLVLAVVYSCAICALIGIYKAISNHLKERPRGKRGAQAGEVIRLPVRTVEPRIRWISEPEFRSLRDANPDIMTIHLLDDGEPRDNSTLFRDELCFTLPQLEETLPWIPIGTQVILYRAEGIDSALARRLRAITHGREVSVLTAPIPQVVRNTAQMTGDVCS